MYFDDEKTSVGTATTTATIINNVPLQDIRRIIQQPIRMGTPAPLRLAKVVARHSTLPMNQVPRSRGRSSSTRASPTIRLIRAPRLPAVFMPMELHPPIRSFLAAIPYQPASCLHLFRAWSTVFHPGQDRDKHMGSRQVH